MPLTKREVSPVLLCRHRLPSGVRDKELQCIANGTLANLIRQLGSLSSHAEDLFAELSKDLIKIEHRTNLLQTRLDSLGQKVNDLDSGIDETSIRSFYLRKPFKSKPLIDQQSLSRHTMPTAMGLRYQRCCPPPRLDKLDCFRDDGKSAMKFYTDPDYFFELWRCEMLSNGDNAKRATKAVKKHLISLDAGAQKVIHSTVDSRTSSTRMPADYNFPASTTTTIARDRQQLTTGLTKMPTSRVGTGQSSSAYPYGQSGRWCPPTNDNNNGAASNDQYSSCKSPLRPSQPPPLPPGQPLSTNPLDVQSSSIHGRPCYYGDQELTVRMENWHLGEDDQRRQFHETTVDEPMGQQFQNGHRPTAVKSVSPELPPPPPPLSTAHSLPANGQAVGAGGDAARPAKAPLPFSAGVPVEVIDTRSDLLKAIRQGIQLKKVDRQEEQKRESNAAKEGHDVAAILKRRMEYVFGRSESEGFSLPTAAILFVASFSLAMTFFSIAHYDIIDEILNPNNKSSSTPRQCSSRCSLLQFSGGEMNQPLLTALRRFTNNQQLLANVANASEPLLEQTAGGKGIRGRLLTGALEANVLFDDRTSLAQKAHTIASAVEMLHAGFLIQDDIMDNASTRRGKPCWYRQVGLSGINDGVLLQSAASWLPSVVLDDHPQKHAIVSSFVEATVITSLGQKLDMEKARPDTCSWDRYRELVTNKTAHYSFWFPLKVGLLLADIQLEEVEIELKNICYEFGFYFQAKDDYLNCFGDEWVTKKHSSDIACGKLTWLLVTAVDMSKLDGDRLKIIWQNYAQSEQRMIQEVRSLYEQLDLRGKFQLFEQAVVEKLSTLVSRLKMPQLCPVLFEMLHLIKNQ
ncbi:hypothetical protein D917_06419 [Trichinella nativa]|uniref:Farnesyl pyrophosphate synthase n=1 Tax=Trichinella nativa TaxID=6335 RepID=A0A1Y3ESG3_9BILA|nr:hypothetical protein D917_06419 [Trichinella nativa]